MPELPEVETVRRVLETWIIGKKIAKVRVRYAPIFDNANEEKVNEVLVGQTVQKIERCGKFLAFIYDKNVVVSHLRMEGKYHFGIEGKDFDLDSKEAKHMHVLFDYTDGTSLIFLDVRKFGRMQLLDKKDYLENPPLNKLGKEPNSIENIEEFHDLLKKNRSTIKQALLDQSIIAGLGNIYVDETLFLSKLNPKMKSNLVTLEDAKNLVMNSRIVVDKAIKLGGSTIKSYHSGNGVDGLFQNELLMYGKDDTPCVNCGTNIVKTVVGGRGTCFCPNCQLFIPNKPIKIIGITGLIGSGKSTVTKLFQEYDVEVIDADKISRSALEINTSAYKKTVETFGLEIVNDDLTINRAKLREITSSSKDKMKLLEDIIHPYVLEKTLDGIKSSKSKYVILDVPLLFEVKMDKLCDLTIFVNTKEDVRIQRLEKRATMPLKDAKRLNNQVMGAKEKIALADIVIENSLDLASTKKQIDKIMQKI